MKQMTNLLGLYGGCDTDELKRIRRLPSRWVALCTTFPSIVIYEGGCYLLHSSDPATVKVTKKRARSDEVGSGLGSDPVTKQQKAVENTREEDEEEGEDGDVGY